MSSICGGFMMMPPSGLSLSPFNLPTRPRLLRYEHSYTAATCSCINSVFLDGPSRNEITIKKTRLNPFQRMNHESRCGRLRERKISCRNYGVYDNFLVVHSFSAVETRVIMLKFVHAIALLPTLASSRDATQARML